MIKQTAIVRYNRILNEYTVQVSRNGVRYPSADYYTSDKADAYQMQDVLQATKPRPDNSATYKRAHDLIDKLLKKESSNARGT